MPSFSGCEDYLGEISCPETGMVHSSVQWQSDRDCEYECEWVTGINDHDLDANANGLIVILTRMRKVGWTHRHFQIKSHEC